MPTPLPIFTSTASKAAFVLVTEVILENDNITVAFKKGGIEDISSILKLTDLTVESLNYSDPDPKITQAQYLKRGEIGLIRAFIHYVHYRQEINDPIDNQWLSITQEDFDQFRCNIKYTRHFVTLSNLPPIAISSVNPTAPSSASTSPAPPSNVPSTVDMFKRGIKCDPLPHSPTPPASIFTLAEAKDAFTYVLENVIENKYVTMALYGEGIDNIISLAKMTDDVVNNLSYLDPDS
jgi:hypothetical protein